MAGGWSKITDESVLDCFTTICELQTKNLGLGHNKLRDLFDQCLCVFFEEVFGQDLYRPLPPMVGNEQSVDLFRLFLVVREKGGYETVSKNGMWDSVAVESGLGSWVASAVKLIYVKYLDTLDRWLQRIVKDKESRGGGLGDDGSDLAVFMTNLESEFKGYLSEVKKKKERDYQGLDLEKIDLNFKNFTRFCKNHEIQSFGDSNGDMNNAEETQNAKEGEDVQSVDLGVSKENPNAKEGEGVESVDLGVFKETQNAKEGEDVEIVDLAACKENQNAKEGENVESVDLGVCKENQNSKEGEDVESVDLGACKEHVSEKKRKRECSSGMLDWIIKVAKNPCDPGIGPIPESSKWKSHGTDQLWKQVLLAREATFLKRNDDVISEQSIWQQKHKMHPSMYDDGSEKVRCSQRIISAKETRALNSAKKSCTRAGSESSSGTHSDSEDRLDKQSDIDSLFENYKKKRIPVGPLFQAEIPQFSEDCYESDSKWLGTKLWPLNEGENRRILIERERIGKGRQDSCGCEFPGSVECVRFHVAEKKIRVKLELGSVFHHWRFDKMGEEVALSWSREDEQKFNDVSRSNPSVPNNCFWDEICKAFPNKSRSVLVSYFFNVFLLQRRAYQNRSNSPANIDSDDEEFVLGSITNGDDGLGHEAVNNSPGSIFGTPKKPHHLNFR